MKTTKIPNFIHNTPLFGLDIGYGSLKVMQLAEQSAQASKTHRPRIIGYGHTTFDKTAQADGVITKPEVIAAAAQVLFEHQLIGDITTRRTAIAIPAYRTFARAVQLPKLKASEIQAAVELEAEQYISVVPLDELYLDYEIIKQTEEATEVFVVAVPRTIVDSYLELAQILGLETVLIEPTPSSSGRLFSLDTQSDIASFIIDFGSRSADISIFDKHILASGTVQSGGVNFTESIKTKLDVSLAEAGIIKTRYGLNASKRQTEIRQALEPSLQKIVKEIQRMVRYYEEHYGTDRPLSQIITFGGGANMPGLSEYLTESLRLAVRHSDPWQYLDFKGLQAPAEADKPMFATAAGLSLIAPREVFA